MNNNEIEGLIEDLVDSEVKLFFLKWKLWPIFMTQAIKKAKLNFQAKGYFLSQILAVYPNIEFPKFIVPFEDSLSHRFLFNEIIYPRRYGLGFLRLQLLLLYKGLINRLKNTSTFHLNIVLVFEKNENTF